MKPEKIKKLIRTRTREIAKLCKQTNEEFDKETIHKFRTSLKSLRSFLRLLQLTNPDKPIKISGKFLHLYHISGLIRDTQLEIERVKETGLALPCYLTHLHDSLDFHKRQWMEAYSDNTVQNLNKELGKYEPASLHPDNLQQFYIAMTLRIEGLCSKKIVLGDDVHKIRKRIKDIVLVAEIVKTNWKSAGRQLSKTSLEQADELATAHGTYHDQMSMLQQMTTFPSDTMGHEEKKQMHILCMELQRQTKKDKRKVLASTRKLVKLLRERLSEK